jgi:hypothetical protein
LHLLGRDVLPLATEGATDKTHGAQRAGMIRSQQPSLCVEYLTLNLLRLYVLLLGTKHISKVALGEQNARMLWSQHASLHIE